MIEYSAIYISFFPEITYSLWFSDFHSSSKFYGPFNSFKIKGKLEIEYFTDNCDKKYEHEEHGRLYTPKYKVRLVM